MIYAAFDADGKCLYVGQTHRHPALRWAEHVRGEAEWVWRAVEWRVVNDLSEYEATARLQPEFCQIGYASRAPLKPPTGNGADHESVRVGGLLDDSPIELD